MAYSYSQLVGVKATAGSIMAWCNSSAVPSTDILTEAQAWIYEKLRWPQMRIRATFALAVDEYVTALPAGFLEPISLQVDGQSAPIGFLDEQLFRLNRDSDGVMVEGWPAYYTIMGENMVFDATPTEALAGEFWHYAIPDDLSADNETNFLTQRLPSLLRKTCMAFGYEHQKRNDQRDMMLKDALVLVEQANITADLGRRGQIR